MRKITVPCSDPFCLAYFGTKVWVETKGLLMPRNEREWNNAITEYCLIAAINN